MNQSNCVKFSIRSEASQLAPVRKSVEAFSAQNGFNEKAIADIGLCLNEALANVIRHAYHDRHDEPIEIEAAMNSDTLHLKIRDWGDGVKPDMLRTVAKDPMKPGGLGLICLGRLMDKVTFTKQPRGMLLEMQKKK